MISATSATLNSFCGDYRPPCVLSAILGTGLPGGFREGTSRFGHKKSMTFAKPEETRRTVEGTAGHAKLDFAQGEDYAELYSTVTKLKKR